MNENKQKDNSSMRNYSENKNIIDCNTCRYNGADITLPLSCQPCEVILGERSVSSPTKSSTSISSLRSWTATISTASSEDYEYDNYQDEDVLSHTSKLTTPSLNREIARSKAGVKFPSTIKKVPKKQNNPLEIKSIDVPYVPNSTVIRLVSPSVNIFQTLLEVGVDKQITAASSTSNFELCAQYAHTPVSFYTMRTMVEPQASEPTTSLEPQVAVDIEFEYCSPSTVSLAVQNAKVDEKNVVDVAVENEEKSVDHPIRVIRSTPDWTEYASSGDHLWVSTSASGEWCYFGDIGCTRQGPRLKCAACKIISHTSCIQAQVHENKPLCKPSFHDVDLRQYREQTKVNHHWIQRRMEKGKCKHCRKSLQAKLSFGSKEIVAVSCAWCKHSYHNKEACFNQERSGEECSLGVHRNIIVPPSWIIKLPKKGNFKSSLRGILQKKRKSSKKLVSNQEERAFVIKPIPTANISPVLVFINPKSGGNQGAKLLQKFQWLLNPRQVFDLTQGGPRLGLELFRHVPQLRVLACGGDGTVGWVLSVLDQINFTPPPAVGVLPLGTGNDLARALGWGGGYTDEPISKILENIGKCDTVFLDRWSVNVTPNTSVQNAGEGNDTLPLNVVNNYFSLGVDAHIALEFHEAREAHPEKFNSRLRNKMFYGQAGGKDLLKRKWKALAEFVKLECDGKDLTFKLKEHKVHAIVFLNIPSYGGGTHPWNKSGGQFEPSTDDGMIEVVGLTTYQLPLLQAGGHGTCIAQCKSAKITTSKTIPMQVDGEACKLKPSKIELTLLNKAVMLAKKKQGRTNMPILERQESMKLKIAMIAMSDYEQHQYDKNLLQQSAVNLGSMEIPVMDLERLRPLIDKYIDEHSNIPKLSSEWCFIDSCTAERFFRIDRSQENLHFITDIASDCLYVLDNIKKMMQVSDEEQQPSPIISSKSNYNATVNNDNSSRQLINRISTESLSSDHRGIKETKNSTREAQPAKLNDLPCKLEKDLQSNSLKKSDGLCQAVNFKSFHERLFGLNEDALGLSNLLEKTTDSLIEAAKTGDMAMLKDLHFQGYSLLSIDSTGQTALHHSSRVGHKDIVRYLISYAPNSIINMIDNESGQTALHKAVANKHRSICYMLVAGGANLNIQDQTGQTVRMLAAKMEDVELEFYIENQEKFHLNDFTNNNN